MLQMQAAAGVDRVVFTPHFYASQNNPQEFLRRRKQSWMTLLPHMRRGLPKVSFGAEVQYFEGICQADGIQALKIVGTPYLLLEMPFHRWDNRMLDDVLELNQHSDTTIVLAHIDRYFSYTTPESIAMLRDNGVKIQMNISAFENQHLKKRAMAMAMAHEVHVLGSDCHNTTTRKPNWELLPSRVEFLLEHSAEYRSICDTLQNITV